MRHSSLLPVENLEKLSSPDTRACDVFVSSKLGLVGNGGSRGVFALEAVEAGELLVHVPATQCLISSDWSSLVTSFVTELKQPSRLPQPYMKLLPKESDVDPAFSWSCETLDKLCSGTSLYCDAVDLREKISSSACEEQSCTASDVWRAEVLLRSRCYQDTLEGKPVWVVLPWIDMFNYKPDSPCAVPTAAGEGFELRAAVDACPGDELYADYHQKSTSELVLSYGFAPSAPNPHTGKLRWRLEPLQGLHGRVQRQLKLDVAEVSVANPLPNSLVAWCRLQRLSNVELKRMLQLGQEKLLVDPTPDTLADIHSGASHRLEKLEGVMANCSHNARHNHLEQRRAAMIVAVAHEEATILHAVLQCCPAICQPREQ